MYLIQQITTDANQSQTLVLPDGTSVAIVMYYSSIQQGWFFLSITYQSFLVQGLRITNNPNLLQQWRNSIPFGIGCFSVNNREPYLIQDFAQSASSLYILTSDEVASYQTYLEGTGTLS